MSERSQRRSWIVRAGVAVMVLAAAAYIVSYFFAGPRDGWTFYTPYTSSSKHLRVFRAQWQLTFYRPLIAIEGAVDSDFEAVVTPP